MSAIDTEAVARMQKLVGYFTGQHYDFVKEFGSLLRTGTHWALQAIELDAVYHYEPDPEATPPIDEQMIEVRYKLSVIVPYDGRETSMLWLTSNQRLPTGEPYLIMPPIEPPTAEQLVHLGFNAKEIMKRWVDQLDRDAGSFHAKGRRQDQELGPARKMYNSLAA